VRLAWHIQTAHIELRIVFEHGADACQDGAGAGAPGVSIHAGFGAGDPLALAVDQRGLPVDGRSDLHAHPGQTTLHAPEKADVQFAGLDGLRVLYGQNLHLDASRPQACQALTGHFGVGIGHRRHDTSDACRSQCVAAGPGAALVGAGLQRDPGGGAAHVMAALGGIAQRHDFGVRAAGALGVAFAQHGAIQGRDDATHTGVGRSQPQGLAGQVERALHGGRLISHHGEDTPCQPGSSERRVCQVSCCGPELLRHVICTAMSARPGASGRCCTCTV